MFAKSTVVFLIQVACNLFDIQIPYYKVFSTTMLLYFVYEGTNPTFFDGIWFGVAGTYILSFCWQAFLLFWREIVIVEITNYDDDDYY